MRHFSAKKDYPCQSLKSAPANTDEIRFSHMMYLYLIVVSEATECTLYNKDL